MPPDHQEGDAADAIRTAEVALAHQNSTAAQVDLQVVTAVLNAHQRAAASRDALDALQREIEGAVATRTDLDTPAGARDFQRYLIGKLRDIQAVVAGASLDDTSNSALMAAWTSLYNSSKTGPENPDEVQPTAAAPAAAPQPPAAQNPQSATESGYDPYLDALPEDDFGAAPEEASGQYPPGPAPAPAAAPSIPSFGGGGMPGGGFGMPGGLPLSAALPEGLSPNEIDDMRPDPDDPDNRLVSDAEEHEKAAEPASGPTTVTLPNGETLTAATPQLAAVIEAAAGGTPIADAFRHEGIVIPPPGTAVPDPLDPAELAPGDIGMFIDRHALSLGASRALVNGHIQHISTVSGPGFLGWEHPPVPVPVNAPAPDTAHAPAPTRPAIAERTETA